MIQTTITPQKTNFNLKVSLPPEYIGKPVRVSFYLEEETKKESNTFETALKPSEFFGTLSEEDGEKMQNYLLQSDSDDEIEARTINWNDKHFIQELDKRTAEYKTGTIKPQSWEDAKAQVLGSIQKQRV